MPGLNLKSPLGIITQGAFCVIMGIGDLKIQMTESIPEQWAERAQYDFDTAQAMLRSERYLYVLFCCQQALEKIVKGVIAKQTGEFPPRIHDLMGLARKAEIVLDDDQVRLMRQLSEYYLNSRYPDQIVNASADITRGTAAKVLNETEAMLKWLSSML